MPLLEGKPFPFRVRFSYPAAHEGVPGVEEEEAAVGGGRWRREGPVIEGDAVRGESREEDLGAGKDVGEDGVAAGATTKEDEVPVGVGETKVGGGGRNRK